MGKHILHTFAVAENPAYFKIRLLSKTEEVKAVSVSEMFFHDFGHHEFDPVPALPKHTLGIVQEHYKIHRFLGREGKANEKQQQPRQHEMQNGPRRNGCF
jgi:hypothetical protein